MRKVRFKTPKLLIPEFSEKIGTCGICGGKVYRKKIPKHQVQAMNMIQAMNMEEIREGVPPEEEKFKIFCPKCGSNISDEVNFCPNCGENLEKAIALFKETSVIDGILESESDLKIIRKKIPKHQI